MGALGRCSVGGVPGGPVGRWEAASAQGMGQVMGVRGVTFDLAPSGRVAVTLADAFAGPMAAVEMGDRVGSSGSASGRWEVAGPGRLRFHGLAPHGVSVHGRQSAGFVMPAPGAGIGAWVQAMTEHPWAWRIDEVGGRGRLVLEGQLLGGQVEVRFWAAS